MTKEEFINKLSKSNYKLSIIKEIKSIRDIGLNNFVELTDILCEYLSKEEIFEICSFEIKKINKEIKETEDILARYGMVIEKVKNPENVVTILI